jgi:hypothetical protein
MAYTFDEPRLGMLPLASFDSGFIPPNQSTAIPTPPNSLGNVLRATDPTYGQGEFICLKGVASTAIGSLVIYDPTTYATTLCATTTNQARPVAVSMSANILATTFGWYQIGGSAVVAKSTGVKLSGVVSVAVNSTGKIGNTTTGRKILGAKNVVTAASAATTAVIILDRPHLEGGVG